MGSFLTSEEAAGEEAELTGNETLMIGQVIAVAKEREEKRGGGVGSSGGDGW